MTLVYSRPSDGPVTHAFIIGCGRYRSFAQDGSSDRKATVAGAREMARFLLQQQDRLVAPLATIEVLLSDPDEPDGQDTLGLGEIDHDPRGDGSDNVAAANRHNTEVAGMAWVGRARPGDHMIFYFAGHGVLERDRTAVALLQDVGGDKLRPWADSINVSRLASALPTRRTSGSWIFFDACQDVVTDLIERDAATMPGVILLTPGIREVANVVADAVAIAGSRGGGKAWAPAGAEPPYFTQALLRGLRGACAEEVNDLGWAVTGKQLLFCLPKVAAAAFNYHELKPQPLSQFAQEVALLRVDNPTIPVIVSTQTEAHMALASEVSIDDGNGRRWVKDDNELFWRFDLPADDARYRAKAAFDDPGVIYGEASFVARPPAQIVVLKP